MSGQQAYIGNVFFQELSPIVQFREGMGWQVIRLFHGAKNKLATFSLPPFALDVDFELGEVDVTIRATYQVIDPIQLTWELLGNDVETTIWEHPKILNVFDQLGSLDAIIQMVGAILKSSNNDPPDNPSDLADSLTLTGALADDVQEFYTRLIQKQDVFYTSQYVLRKTMLVSPRSDQPGSEITLNHRNVLGIFSYGGLLSEEPTVVSGSIISTASVWTALQVLLTSNFITESVGLGPLLVSGQNLINISELGPGGQNLQWQKRSPQCVAMQRGMYQITQEYWGAKQFDKWKYDFIQ